MTEPLRITRDGSVVQIEMMESKSRNAFSVKLKAALEETVRDLTTDTEAQAVILTGSDGVFCAGGDLKKMLADHKAGLVTGAEDFTPRMKGLHGWLKLLRDLPIPVIVAVDGPAYGAGLGLALTGDIILASTRASFNASFCKVGAVPDGNLFYSLPRMVGLQRAREMFYTGRTVHAEEAQRIGICMEVTEPEALLPRAQEMAQMMCGTSRTAFALTKSISARALETDSDTLLDMEATAQAICLSSAYHKDAIDRFTNKQPPRFDFK
ncbi:enoyl-CoA hydratase [Oceanicola sp. 22II-s10i]|uniref:enoyl-CoA hydratase/isomerase family protein n=1 Tax=Oceanicola sp. 22II-s10i TaxID=1317116 RepID=UPI000B51F96E|nr:enoyl-CoA hydratase-related protein [Oceanicola sp. 22II-s10i]OWU85918.1 enoyl-CoA hydratase [Oceanicola sp. 22II-s10i]